MPRSPSYSEYVRSKSKAAAAERSRYRSPSYKRRKSPSYRKKSRSKSRRRSYRRRSRSPSRSAAYFTRMWKDHEYPYIGDALSLDANNVPTWNQEWCRGRPKKWCEDSFPHCSYNKNTGCVNKDRKSVV